MSAEHLELRPSAHREAETQLVIHRRAGEPVRYAVLRSALRGIAVTTAGAGLEVQSAGRAPGVRVGSREGSTTSNDTSDGARRGARGAALGGGLATWRSSG